MAKFRIGDSVYVKVNAHSAAAHGMGEEESSSDKESKKGVVKIPSNLRILRHQTTFYYFMQ